MDTDPFEIILADSNEESAHFRLQNEPGERQREYVTGYDRRDALRVLGKLTDVVHGRLDPDGDEPCSLAVFEFAALGQKPSRRRYREVQIELVFAAHGTEGRPRAARTNNAELSRWDPQVKALAPAGSKALLETTHTAGRKHAFEAFAEAGADPVATAGVKYVYEISDVVERADRMVVEGAPAFVGRAAGKPNAARFVLRENASQRSGVPRFLRVAVLLVRRAGDSGLFVAEVNVRAHVSVFADAGEKMRRVMGRIPLDDAVVFDPKMPPTTDRFPVDRLASVSLGDECSIESGHAGDESRGDSEE
ncbi:hypothetical protein F4677DRAFT_245580 [Hypoxylon crocopeplum]|nr:hypothetical protein F4677DRAFT_245580 [Hypoxylon crocopeplum]